MSATRAPSERGPDLPPRVRRIVAWCVASLVVAVTAAAGLSVLVALRVVTVPILAALIGTALLSRIARRLVAAGLPRGLASLIACALLLVVAGTASWVLATALAGTSDEIGRSLQRAASDVDNALDQLPRPGGEEVSPARDGVSAMAQLATRVGEALATGLVGGVRLATQVIAGTVLVLTLVFYFLRDGPKLWTGLVSLVPTDGRPQVEAVARRSYLALAGYVRGASLIALIDAVAVLGGLLVLRVPTAAGLAALVFVGAYVPYAGTLLSGTVAVLVALADRGPIVALLTVVLLAVVQAVESTVLQPWIQSRSVQLHPAVVLLALTTGAALGGLVGTLLAVPTAAVVSSLLGRDDGFTRSGRSRRDFSA